MTRKVVSKELVIAKPPRCKTGSAAIDIANPIKKKYTFITYIFYPRAGKIKTTKRLLALTWFPFVF